MLDRNEFILNSPLHKKHTHKQSSNKTTVEFYIMYDVVVHLIDITLAEQNNGVVLFPNSVLELPRCAETEFMYRIIPPPLII